jgi:short-subunit dehydrogenase
MNSNPASMVGRNVVILAATGEIARAVADEMARRGAALYLSARNQAALDALATRLRRRVVVHTAVVDACDAVAVEAYFGTLRARDVGIDFVLNAIGPRPGLARYGARSENLSLAEFLTPIELIVGSQFLSATRCRPAMRAAPTSVVVMLTASLARSATPLMAGITAASDAVQGLSRVLAAEFGADGPRVICARVAAVPQSRTIRETMAANAATLGITADEFARSLPGDPDFELGFEHVGREIADLAQPSARWPSGALIDITAQS